VRLVAPATGGVRISASNQIKLMPATRVGEVMIGWFDGAVGSRTGKTRVPSQRPLNTTASGPV
jgi:hypothetical protein